MCPHTASLWIFLSIASPLLLGLLVFFYLDSPVVKILDGISTNFVLKLTVVSVKNLFFLFLIQSFNLLITMWIGLLRESFISCGQEDDEIIEYKVLQTSVVSWLIIWWIATVGSSFLVGYLESILLLDPCTVFWVGGSNPYAEQCLFILSIDLLTRLA